MKRFACGDLMPGCAAHFTGPSDEDVLSQVAAHARRDHGLTTIPDDLVGRVRDLIQAA
jgi:predicted small metal-binding protein